MYSPISVSRFIIDANDLEYSGTADERVKACALLNFRNEEENGTSVFCFDPELSCRFCLEPSISCSKCLDQIKSFIKSDKRYKRFINSYGFAYLLVNTINKTHYDSDKNLTFGVYPEVQEDSQKHFEIKPDPKDESDIMTLNTKLTILSELTRGNVIKF